MEIKLNKETLGGKKLFVASPQYGGMCYGTFMKSCLDLQGMCIQYGVDCKFSFLFNESLVTRCRNYLSDEFLRSDSTHMIFLDSDISFNAIDVLAMLAMDKEIVGGSYPKKSVNWSKVKKAVMKNPSIEESELAAIAGDMVFNPVVGTTQFNVSEPVEVMDLGTGFMMIRRSAFEKFALAYPESRYKPDHVGTAHFSGDREINCFFDCEIDADTRRYLSEDYFWVQKCRKIGIEIWMCPWIQLTHTGTYTFQGSFTKTAQYLGEL